MNFQDIADFIELVQKPEKFTEALNAMKAEQGRLVAAIETVGKVSEINSIREKISKESIQIEKKLAAADDKAATIVANAKKTYESKLAELADNISKTDIKMQEAQALYAQAVEISSTQASKRKELTALEARLYSLQDELNVKQQEVEDRLKKLRAAMV